MTVTNRVGHKRPSHTCTLWTSRSRTDLGLVNGDGRLHGGVGHRSRLRRDTLPRRRCHVVDPRCRCERYLRLRRCLPSLRLRPTSGTRGAASRRTSPCRTLERSLHRDEHRVRSHRITKHDQQDHPPGAHELRREDVCSQCHHYPGVASQSNPERRLPGQRATKEDVRDRAHHQQSIHRPRHEEGILTLHTDPLEEVNDMAIRQLRSDPEHSQSPRRPQREQKKACRLALNLDHAVTTLSD